MLTFRALVLAGAVAAVIAPAARAEPLPLEAVSQSINFKLDRMAEEIDYLVRVASEKASRARALPASVSAG